MNTDIPYKTTYSKRTVGMSELNLEQFRCSVSLYGHGLAFIKALYDVLRACLSILVFRFANQLGPSCFDEV
jgi:hypothetical protein